jgi:ATP-binding cassette subfamily G (WHITE) protein 2 (PDR)
MHRKSFIPRCRKYRPCWFFDWTNIAVQIHQPSAQLFERFDRLLFLEKGGKTVYFGEVGHGSRVLIDYFTRNGAPSCPRQHNPAEWMLEVIGAAPGSSNAIDWHATWNDSEEKRVVKEELRRMKQESGHLTHIGSNSTPDDQTEFASTYSTQFLEAIKRVAQFYWRSPSYVYSKLILVIGTVSGTVCPFSID